MYKIKGMVVCFGVIISELSSVAAQNLLVNPELELPALAGPNGTPSGWTLIEAPITNTAELKGFANHTPSGEQGLWYRAFDGTTYNNPRPAVDAELYQDIPGIPDWTYSMTGWARFEANWAGGLDFLPSGGTIEPPAPPRWPANTPSPTRTEFALKFLDNMGTVLPGSVVADLHDDLGQMNDNMWHQHSLSAIAPPGTINVRVRASLLDGVNPDLNPQSAFVDGFELIAIPEPASGSLLFLGLVGLATSWRNTSQVLHHIFQFTMENIHPK